MAGLPESRFAHHPAPAGPNIWDQWVHPNHMHTVPAKLAPGSLEHMLIHKPADERCEHCLRGKPRNLRKLAHSLDGKTARFGDIVAADHISFAEEGGLTV